MIERMIGLREQAYGMVCWEVRGRLLTMRFWDKTEAVVTAVSLREGGVDCEVVRCLSPIH